MCIVLDSACHGLLLVSCSSAYPAQSVRGLQYFLRALTEAPAAFRLDRPVPLGSCRTHLWYTDVNTVLLMQLNCSPGLVSLRIAGRRPPGQCSRGRSRRPARAARENVNLPWPRSSPCAARYGSPDPPPGTTRSPSHTPPSLSSNAAAEQKRPASSLPDLAPFTTGPLRVLVTRLAPRSRPSPSLPPPGLPQLLLPLPSSASTHLDLRQSRQPCSRTMSSGR
jgi:hypothetical protein